MQLSTWKRKMKIHHSTGWRIRRRVTSLNFPCASITLKWPHDKEWPACIRCTLLIGISQTEEMPIAGTFANLYGPPWPPRGHIRIKVSSFSHFRHHHRQYTSITGTSTYCSTSNVYLSFCPPIALTCCSPSQLKCAPAAVIAFTVCLLRHLLCSFLFLNCMIALILMKNNI